MKRETRMGRRDCDRRVALITSKKSDTERRQRLTGTLNNMKIQGYRMMVIYTVDKN